MTIAQTKAVRSKRRNDPRWKGKGNAVEKSAAKALRLARLAAKAKAEGRSFGYGKK